MAGLPFVGLYIGIFFVFYMKLTSAQPGSSTTPSSTTAASRCEDDEFDCGSEDIDCLYEGFMCDHFPDCYNGADEDSQLCGGHVCEDDEFECYLGRAAGEFPYCVWDMWVCDDYDDCELGEDEAEELCNKPTTPIPACPEDGFRCKDNSCILKTDLCNHRSDCYRGEDEEDCDYPVCDSSHFQCASGQCVGTDKQCDGTDDCHDRTDEDPALCDTGPVVCTNSQFTCDNDVCVDLVSTICNTIDDCGDNSDESFCDSPPTNECDLNATLCDMVCKDTFWGYYCDCNEGYQLMSDGRNCEDIDECTRLPLPCSQQCRNNKGGRICECAEGYKKKGKVDDVCVREDSTAPYLIVSNELYIRKFELETNTYSTLSDHHTFNHILDYDLAEEKIYYADVLDLEIKSMDFDGSNIKLLNFHFTGSVEGIAVDWVGRMLYWTSTSIQGVFVSHINGSSTKALVRRTSELPRALAVYPAKGYMYWSDWSYRPHISRAGLDGSDYQELHTEGIFWPNGLTIDFAADKLFWVDAYFDRVEVSDLDGKNRLVVITELHHAFGLTVFEDNIYWSDWSVKQIMTAHKFTGENKKELQQTLHRPFDLHVVHPLRQPKSPNPCGTNNGGCSHLCLISPGGATFTCHCPEQYIMTDNNKTCKANCTAEQFECPGTDAKCIPQMWFCDGEDDCKGGADEPADNVECQNRHCDPGYYQCSSEQKCIPPSFICDKYDDCPDGADEKGCASRQCQPFEFRCDSGQCVHASKQCDGSSNCWDGTDEHEGCDNRTCDANWEFTCANGKCIDKMWFCDWDDDCGDKSDEPAAYCQVNTTCQDGWARCRTNYRCIPLVAFCDGNDNCRDGSDEDPDRCPACDPKGDFTCDNKQCIPMRWYCDHKEHCTDGSDESSCISSDYRDCSEKEFRCKDPPQCIRKDFMCNLLKECMDGTDEKDCENHECKEDEFKCVDGGHCITSDYKCDTRSDCPDGSDEKGCDTECPSRRSFRCDNDACVPPSYRCDAEDDCGDNSDEKVELCANVSCPFFRFQCKKNKYCLSSKYVCDGTSQCGTGDNSDEDPHTTCPEKHEAPKCDDDEYQCITSVNKSCISVTKLCDKEKDCPDGFDELGCNTTDGNTCANNNTGCAHNCQDVSFNETHTGGYFCYCRPGYRNMASDPKDCEDIDECASWGNFCPQTCTNQKGSFICTCVEGYERMNESKACVAKDDSPILLVPMGHEIRTYSLDEGVYSDAVVAQLRIIALDVDTDNRVVYWTDPKLNAIKRAKVPTNPLDFGIPQTLRSTDMDEPEGIAYDWLGKNVFWCQPNKHAIYALMRDRPSLVKTIVKDDSTVFYPAHIVMASDIGYMFWLDMNPSEPKIERAYTNGASRRELITEEIVDPRGLAVDYHMGHRLYWSDSKLETIYSCDMDGKDRVVVREVPDQRPYNMDVFAGTLYWNSMKEEAVFKMDKFGKEPPTKILQDVIGSRDIKVFHANRYSSDFNPCAAGTHPCQVFCFPVPNGQRECGCPDGMNIPNKPETTCSLPTWVPVLPPPSLCACNGHGMCVINKGNPECVCDDGYEGESCDPTQPVTMPSPSTAAPSTAAPSTAAPTRPQTTTVAPRPTVNAPDKIQRTIVASMDSKKLASIVGPLVAVIVVVILILIGLVWWMHRNGTLQKSAYRPHNNLAEDMHDITSPSDGDTQETAISFHDGNVKYDNPMYQTLQSQKESDQSVGEVGNYVQFSDTNGNAPALPTKSPV